MNGDFSSWAFDDATNATGVLQQQGRLLLDRDWNAQTLLTERWQDEAARGVFGRVAAVSSAGRDGWLVRSAAVSNGVVQLDLEAGQVWADGVLAYLRDDDGAASGTVRRSATHDGAPFHTPAELAAIKDSLGKGGTRDAVVLELWREAVSGFQVPGELIEPALGGVDTTERMSTSFSFHLVRLGAREPCEDLEAKLTASANPGRLTVSLQPVQTTSGDCPVVEGGGYVGFEHNLYRVEIAKTDSAAAMFKWSQYNGGLVGRGHLDTSGGKRRLLIRHNRQPILRSGLENFYLEILAPVPDRATRAGAERLAERWEPVYGARVSLTEANELTLPDAGSADELLGSIPPTTAQGETISYFFRLWNGIESVAAFQGTTDGRGGAVPHTGDGGAGGNGTGVTPSGTELHDGIRLQFGAQGTHRPGDHWVFPVRAGEIENPGPVLIDDQPPTGIRRLRVPLAVLEWTDDPRGITYAAGEIEDRRSVVPALSDLDENCCVAVSPDEDLHCVLEDLKKAGGGCVCLLPGDHRIDAPLDFSRARNITIKGFGLASRLHPVWDPDQRPMFVLDGAAALTFQGFTVVAAPRSPVWSCSDTVGLELSEMNVLGEVGSAAPPIVQARGLGCRDWRLERNLLMGGGVIETPRLTGATLRDNLWLCARRGVQARELVEVRIERNRFTGMNEKISGEARGIVSSVRTDGPVAGRTHDAGASRKITESLVRLVTSTIPAMIENARLNPEPLFLPVQCTAALDVDFSENDVRSAAAAFFAETSENLDFRRNRITNAARGASIGLAHGLRFIGNRIVRSTESTELAVLDGLFLFGDAIDCRITDNLFRGVRNAIRFGDFTRNGEVTNRFVSLLPAAGEPLVSKASGDAFYRAAVDSHNSVVAALTLWDPSFFRFSRCERTLIQGNRIEASDVGVGWFEGSDIVDFRVTANAFSGCSSGAVVIEPHDWVHFLADDAETKVRLVDKNTFQIGGPAVRATSGAVRVEDNDIRLEAGFFGNLSWADVAGLVANTVYESAELRTAVSDADAPIMRMLNAEVAETAEGAPGGVKTKALMSGGTPMLTPHMKTLEVDSAAFALYSMSNLALVNPGLVVETANRTLPLSTIQIERFVVNLSGHDNRVVDNRLQSANPGLDGGIVLQTLSGEVTGNEVETGRYALAVKTSASQPRGDLRIEGNTLRVTGAPPGGGKQPASYALAIPNLSPGNVSILDNLFEGSIQVGAEPFSSLNLVTTDKFDFAKFLLNAHVINYDAKTFHTGLDFTAIAGKETLPTIVAEPIIVGVVPVVVSLFELDPHRKRAVIQFSDNRVIRGWAALAASTAGSFWNADDLEKQAAAAPLVQLSGNVFDYWARVVGHDVVLVGNMSQTPVEYRFGHKVEATANIPAAKSF